MITIQSLIREVNRRSRPLEVAFSEEESFEGVMNPAGSVLVIEGGRRRVYSRSAGQQRL